MFINIKLSKLFKIFFITVAILMILFFGVGVYKVFSKANEYFVKDTIKEPDVVELTSSNYTNVLKAVNDNIDSYVGIKIKFIGYVYRIIDFTDNQFVLARNMVISSDYQAVVVGFLCEYENAKDFADNAWVEVTGSIKKGDYMGDIPIIEVLEMKQADCPTDEYVYPPDETYIPTNALL